MKCNNNNCTSHVREFDNNCAQFEDINKCSHIHYANMLEVAAEYAKDRDSKVEEDGVPELPQIQNDSALDVQVGGGHYKNMAIQPIEFTHRNNLNFCQGNIIKYTCRYKNKGGIEDLKKVKHYVELLMELEYGRK